MTFYLSFKVFLVYKELKEIVDHRDVLVWKAYPVKAVCKINSIVNLIWYIMQYFVSILGGITLPGLRGDAGREGLPGRPGLR